MASSVILYRAPVRHVKLGQLPSTSVSLSPPKSPLLRFAIPISGTTVSLRDSTNPFYDAFSKAQSQTETLLTAHLPAEVSYIENTLFTGHVCSIHFLEIELKLQLDFRHTYPFFHHEIANETLSRKKVDAIRHALRAWIPQEQASIMSLDTALTGPLSFFDIAVFMLRLIEFITSFLQQYRAEESQSHSNDNNEVSQGWDARAAHTLSLTDIIRNQHGIDLRTVRDITAHIIGQTIADIQRSIASLLCEFRVVHFEPVLRADLAGRFLRQQAEMRETLRQTPVNTLRKFVGSARLGRRSDGEALVEELLRPRLTFHGTRKDVVGDIVRFGFLRPGDVHPRTNEALPVRCGSTYGRGIYTSPSPSFALGYSGWDGVASETASLPGLKLLVCAVLMGRPAKMFRDDDWREQTKPYPGADSHVGNGGFEYIVFQSAQILPCYVLHLDWADIRAENVMGRLQANIQRGPGAQKGLRDVEAAVFPGERQRWKEERLARARKFFAYGYGPVPGNKIMIEDIADDDDDEEEYGDYQRDRLGIDAKEKSVWDWDNQDEPLEGESRFDEYADARKAYRKFSKADRRKEDN